MKLPRDMSGDHLAKALAKSGYAMTRHKGPHIRLTTQLGGEHHITIPRHTPLRFAALSGVLDMVAKHIGITRQELIVELFA